jgi:hypothetical protein
MLAQVVTANDDVCTYFTAQGIREFATIAAADSCPEAIKMLAAKVTVPTAYINPDGETVATTAGTTGVNVCAITWNRYGEGAVAAGPQPGHFHPRPF